MLPTIVKTDLIILDFCLSEYQDFLSRFAININSTEMYQKARRLFHLIHTIRVHTKLLIKSAVHGDNYSLLMACGLTHCLPDHRVFSRGQEVTKDKFYLGKLVPEPHLPKNHYLVGWHNNHMPVLYDEKFTEYIQQFLVPTFRILHARWNVGDSEMFELLATFIEMFEQLCQSEYRFESQLGEFIFKLNILFEYLGLELKLI